MTVSATDGDGEALTYGFKTVNNVVQNSGGKFAINATTGAITTVNTTVNNAAVGGVLSYASEPVHTLVVTVTDASNNVEEQTVTVNVTNVKSSPTFDTTTAAENATTKTISEAMVPGTGIGLTALAGTSAEDSATIASYDITAQSSAGQFAIDPSSGVITLAKALDYEAFAANAAKTHTFTVTATTTDGETATQDLSLIHISEPTRP